LPGSRAPCIATPRRGTIRWHWIEAGSGPALVLVHGMPETAFAWRHQLTAFAPSYRVIAVDLPGFGLSDKRDGDYSVAAIAAWFGMLLQQVAPGPIRLVGHDWGGMVAARYAGEHPDRIVAYAHVAAPLTRLDLGRWPDYRDFHDDPGHAAGFLRDPEVFVRRIFDATVANTAALTESDLQRHIEEFGRSGVRHAVGYWFRDLDIASDGELGPSVMADWSAMTWPVQVIVGDRDLQAPLEAYLGAGGLMPDYRGLVVIDDAGHYPAEEQPQQFNQALEALFSR